MNRRSTALVAACLTTLAGSLTAQASAQEIPLYAYHADPPAWDYYAMERRHELIGTVTHFEPFRLQLARPDGTVQTIDLKNGTVIRPTGTTPMVGERVNIEGYYSKGTFIANRLDIRP